MALRRVIYSGKVSTLFERSRRLRHSLRTQDGVVLSMSCVIKVTMFTEILKNCYFGLRNLNFTGIGRKVQMFSQENVTHEASRYQHGEYICCSELATAGPR